MLNGFTSVGVVLGSIIAFSTVFVILVKVYKALVDNIYKNCPIGKQTLEKMDNMCKAFDDMNGSVSEMNERGRSKALLDSHRDNMIDALVDVSELQLRLMKGEALNGEVATALKSIQYNKRVKREAQNKLIAEEVNVK